MMNQTHVAAGVSLAAGFTAVPGVEPTTGLALAGAVGGAVPDLDLFVGRHRRTLHAPVLSSVGALLAAAVWVGTDLTAALFVATALGAAGLHAASDALGAGDELRPWERTSREAVYLHVAGRWLRPRYLVRYDGAPEDVLVAVLAAVPGLVVFDGPLRWGLVALLVSGAVYALVRKRTVAYAERFVDR
jgi:hypothetical protein